MKPLTLATPILRHDRAKLIAGQEVLLSGVIYTARDAAHQRLAGLLASGKKLPVDFRDQVIYYAGPTPAPSGMVIGSCGPTTSSRMDRFTPALIAHGLGGMIGKGDRSPEICSSIARHRAVYFLAPAGLGALCSTRIVEAKVIAYRDLGAEAIYRLVVKDFPLIVGIDSKGTDIYGTAQWKKK